MGRPRGKLAANAVDKAPATRRLTGRRNGQRAQESTTPGKVSTAPASLPGRGRISTAVRAKVYDHVISSDDMSEEESQLSTGEDAPSKSAVKVLKEVCVPVARSSEPKSRQRQHWPSHSPSSRSSALSSVGDRSIDYNTPGTSTAATPAEFGVKTQGLDVVTRNMSKSRLGGLESRLQGRLDEPASIIGKRKRKRVSPVEATDDEMNSDALLARALQEEEYQSLEPKRAKTGNRRRPVVLDSDDDLEIDILDSESEDVVSEEPASVGHRRRTGGQPSVPRRDFQYVAQRRVTGIAPSGITDTDESALSEPLSSVDSADFDSEESDFDEEGDPQATSNPATASGQRRRPVPTANPSLRATRSIRRFRRHGNRAEMEREKLENAHPEIKTLWETLEAEPIIVPTKAEQPGAITRKLKPFQLEGLNWMIRQEQSKWKGGLLGDEMGMGKTIQAVSLLMSDYPAKNPTLVVVPPVALMQWQSEINQYTDGKLKVLIYHNTNTKVKTMKVKDLKTYDVIMISYSGLESIYRKESKGWKREGGIIKENSVIHAIHYHRLILDEAHNIKSRTAGVAKACFALKADYKWCLSGTPVQNRIGEFFSLLRFLEVKPFACYFCKSCGCAELHWSQDAEKKCTSCHHSGFQHVSIFNQELLNPITSHDDPEIRRAALKKLRLLTDRIMLRRLKRDHTASMELPPKDVVIHNEFFGDIERDFSSSIMSNTTRQFDTYVSRGVMLNNYANIFGLIMQMRQVSNHPDLLLRKHAQGGQNVLVCSICDDVAEEPIRSHCHHEFCRKCVKDYVQSFATTAGREPDCPRCHIPLAIDFDQPDIEQDEDRVKKSSIINRIKMEDWTSSTKIEMLVYELYKLRSKKQTHKSIVFSQFTSMLQLVEWRLRRAGFSTVMLDGTMTPVQRQRSIEHFMNNVEVEVFLVSLKAGGVALNLTEASRVFIVDPWWNPAAEWQSADRCHRIGQKRPCVITRLVVEDSVESRIVMLQEKKANMINGTVNNDEVALESLSPEDMQFLFRGT